MKLLLRKNINLIIVIAIALCFLLCALTGLIIANNHPLSSFNIKDVADVDGVLNVITDKVNNATKYIVNIYDDSDNNIYSNESDSNRIPIDLYNLNYGDHVHINVRCYNINNNEKLSNNLYDYTYKDPTFDASSNHIITNIRLFLFNIMGDVDNSYHIDIMYQSDKILELPVDNNNVYLSYNLIANYKGRLTANLINNKNRIVSTFNFYNSPTLVSDVKITSPNTVDNLSWEDILLSYTGGDNATSVKAVITSNNKVINTIIMDNNTKYVKIDAANFKENTAYNIKVIASWQNYDEIAKSDAIDINIGSKSQVLPVFVDHYEAKIKQGTQIKLATRTEDATIKYTLDGTDPNAFGIDYHDPIIINKNMIIKAIAYKDKMDDSDLENYNFTIYNDIQVIYLSPSSQSEIYGVKAAGYTTEMAWMNKVCDVVEESLKKNNVKVYRNNPNVEGKMHVWLAESRKVGSDLHIAIHSNASHDHDAQGMEVYVDASTSLGYSFANILYNNLYSIYPYQSNETNHGVKYALGGLGEVNTLNISRGVLIEIAYHDNYDDAKWIVDNYEKIGENIASSIISFYQIGGN